MCECSVCSIMQSQSAWQVNRLSSYLCDEHVTSREEKKTDAVLSWNHLWDCYKRWYGISLSFAVIVQKWCKRIFAEKPSNFQWKWMFVTIVCNTHFFQLPKGVNFTILNFQASWNWIFCLEYYHMTTFCRKFMWTKKNFVCILTFAQWYTCNSSTSNCSWFMCNLLQLLRFSLKQKQRCYKCYAVTIWVPI